MTLADIKQIRDNLKNAILALDLTQLDHNVGDANYSHDQHRENLMNRLDFWDKRYVAKLWAGRKVRQDQKAV